MANPTIYIGSKFDAKGFKKAESAVGKLNKNLKSLAGTFGILYGTKQIVAFGKASLKAFTEDDKAAKLLGQTLKNTGNALAGKGAESFIAKLEKTAAVSDDQLRPAFTNLLNSTRDYKTSQQELNLALNIAAGTGKDVVTVSAALSKAYAGNATALTRLGTGISKTVLLSGDMNKINEELAKLFAGQSAVAAGTFAGKLNALTIAGHNAMEVIGKGLVQALTEASGSFSNATTEIGRYAQVISDTIIDVGRSTRYLGAVLGFIWKGPTQALKDYKNTLAELQAQHQLDFAPATGTPSSAMAIMAKESRAADKAATKKLATDKKSAAAKLLADKKAAALKLALSKGAAAFDLDKIQLIAALKMNIDEGTQKRLLLLQALQGTDNDLIMKRLRELADFTENADLRKLAGLKTITDAQLKALSDTLIAEVDAINKSKMSQDDKNKAIMEALNKYDAAIKAQGGATADQSDNLRILQIRNIMAIATAQTIADKQKQDALELYLRTMGMNTRAITPLDGGGGFFAGGGFSPPTMGGGNGTGGTSSDWIDYSQTSSDLAAQQFGSGGTTIIAPTVLPVVLTDGAGFQSAIQQQLQILARDGKSTAATSGLLNQFL